MSEDRPFESTTLHVGAHEVSIEEPDLVTYCFRGDVAPEELRILAAVERSAWPGKEQILVFIELQDVTLLPGMISAGVEVYRGAPARLLAVVGMSFSMRIGLEMAARPLSLIGFRNVLRGFTDEQSARAWLCEQRAPHPA